MSLMITDRAASPETRSDKDFVIVTSDFVQTKGSRENKLANLSVEAPGRQGAKTQDNLDIPSLRNAVGRDASASKMLSYF
jgi:hypothetical protein